MNRISKLALFAVLALFLFSCGQRGPLYLPEQAPTNESAQETPESSEQPATATSSQLSSTEGEQ
jgi:predicted small lipoprotein YifL